MRLAVLTRRIEPFSLRVHRTNLVEAFEALGVEILPFGEDEQIPESCELIWDPGIAGAMPPYSGFKSLNKPLVVTVHGASPFVMPLREVANNFIEGFRGKLQCYRTLYQWRWFRKKVTRVITVSEFAKNEISRVYKLPQEMISVVYHGVNHNIFSPEGESQSGKYLLVVGANRRIKNVERIFMAYKRLAIKDKPEMIAVLPDYKKLHDIKGLIIVRKGLEPAELAKYYRGAIALVFPSLRESFGMPILEAMASGCPVITSNTSACAEVAVDAAILVDPRSVDEIANAIKKLIENEPLWQELRNKGFDRARQFAWRKAAEEHIKVFRDVIKSR